MDIKGARFWAGAKESLELGLTQCGFFTHTIELIEDVFAEDEVDEIWITFPDPQIKFKRTKHRLTNPQFLARYQKILKAEGKIHLKTDNEFLHGYTLGLLEGKGWEVDYAHHDVYGNPHAPKHVTAIQTHYEKLFLEKDKLITYLTFRFPMDDNFFERVYTVVRQIPEGRVTAYGAIARKIGPPKVPVWWVGR